MLIKELDSRDADLCFELDSNTISLWSRKQWTNELTNSDKKVFGLLFFDEIIGICVYQVVLDEAQINYFSVKKKFRRLGYGTCLIRNLIKQCEILGIKRLLLEVSENNFIANNFYNKFDFLTVGVRKNYYKDGSHALLKEKKLKNNFKKKMLCG